MHQAVNIRGLSLPMALPGEVFDAAKPRVAP